MAYLITDIETIPDTTVWTPPKVEEEPPVVVVPPSAPASVQEGAAVVPIAQPAKPARKPRTKKAPADVFPPLYAHRVIAISFIVVSNDLVVRQMGVVGTSTYGDDERRMLTDFNGFVMQQEAAYATEGFTAVTWAGRRFDLPVLALRAFKYGIDQRWYTGEHRQRYNERSHLDLFAALTEYGAFNTDTFKLDTFSRLLGLPGKGETDGSKVFDMFKAGQIPKIEAYCLMDSARTTFVLLRYKLMRGQITIEEYRQAAGALLQLCMQMQLNGIVFGCDEKKLLLTE